MNKLLLLVALFACATYASICHSWGDPHNRLLNGRTYDLYRTQGDFTFFQYKNILIQERVSNSRTWGTNSLLIGAAVRVGRKTFEILNNIVRINKKVATIAQVRAAGVQVSGNVFTIATQGITIKIHNHAANDAISGRNYLSLYVDVPAALQKSSGNRMRGLCLANESGRFAVRNFRRSLFATKPKYVTLPALPPRQFTVAQTNAARAACRKTGLRRQSSLNNCVFDYLRAKDKNAVLRAYSGDRKDNVALRKIDKRNNKKLSKKNKCRRAIRRLRRTVRRLRANLASATRTRNAAVFRANSLSRQNSTLRRQVNSLNNRVRNAENRVRFLTSQLNATRRSLSNAVAARRRAEQQVRRLRAQLRVRGRRCAAKLRSQRRRFNDTLRRQQQSFQRRFAQMQKYYTQVIARLQRRK